MNRFADRNARILLAEDNATNQLVALGILKKLGLQADVAENGLECLKSLKSKTYDLILMDIQMPEMDGIAATRHIRKSTAVYNTIPIVAMTAHAMQGDRERFLAAGMNDYVTKPVSPQSLAAALDRWLPGRNPATSESSSGQSEPALTPQQASEIFDRAGMMLRLMDDNNLVRMVIESFLEDMPRQITALKNYIASSDAIDAERQAHTIKGASASVGGNRMRETALAMEKATGAGDMNRADKLMTELEGQFERLRRLLIQEL
jgi:CheY-like chemotaxis protein/HPt (histidine-containing phosphotransfer) domain-containing protein